MCCVYNIIICTYLFIKTQILQKTCIKIGPKTETQQLKKAILFTLKEIIGKS